ncbi:polysaccharide deacetylase [Pseudohoeflea suaedae]|uniref:Chitooligosaccharide deacetylase n=1 Tax=Pseudohoeflea suaedae TaxID=877384 RepID=A0A4R5PP34_9HYPH|nr:polysaccharide deacetylase family protein [Pseudohoeflea suaedae]TDH38678.1 polysaccharide deacetylase [Pseudohoeflea suaedae]
MLQGPKAVAARRWIKQTAILGGLEIMSLASRTGLAPDVRGKGAIFTLHHVRPHETKAFDPVAHLNVTPDFLEAAIVAVKAAGMTPIALDDLPEHAKKADETKPVVMFTLDDGYKDNLEHAAPVFARHGIPFTVFATGGFIDRTHSIWWKTAEELIRKLDRFEFDFGDGVGVTSLVTETLQQKYAAYDRLYRSLACASQHQIIARLDEYALDNGIDPLAIVDREVMDEAGLRELIKNPLASLGAHTISHCNMAHVPDEQLRAEIEQSVSRIEAITGKRPSAFAYPYGGRCAAGEREFQAVRESGVELAVTTTADILRMEDANARHRLNRISLNGYYQKTRYVEVLASGLPFAARNLVF